MKVGFVCSNAFPIGPNTKKGTEIFVGILLSRLSKNPEIDLTVFASSDSDIPAKKESLGFPASSTDETMPLEKYIMFELVLISKAFLKEKQFDLFNIHIGDGDLVMPFTPFVKKPILISIHHFYDLPYTSRYFSLFKDLQNVYFVSASDAQRKLFPGLNYIKTIYHGIEEEQFAFDEKGGEALLWVGRGIPIKGLHHSIAVVRETGRTLKACVIRKKESEEWLKKEIHGASSLIEKGQLVVSYDVKREDLVLEYQKSKAFVFPTQIEEIFGLVSIEAAACGTPVIAFAKGAIPEVVKDGETGFLVNPSDTDIRGDFIVKKTGVKGLIEAVERIYALPEQEYMAMRKACRQRVEKNFTADRMAKEYAALYKEIASFS